MKYDIDWITNKFNRQEKLKYLFFWGHTPKGSDIDKSCFSQWYPAPFSIDEINYFTAEHWMMAQKAKLFKDKKQLNIILKMGSPEKAKQAGRSVANFDDALWKQHAYAFVVEGNLHKFRQHAGMKIFLLETGNKVIVEASPYDKIWGIGTGVHEENPLKWKGSNLLGFALMEVRDMLAAEEQTKILWKKN